MQDLPITSDPNSPFNLLRDLWEQPTVTVTTQLPALPIGTSEVINATLWDAGQTVIVGNGIVAIHAQVFGRVWEGPESMPLGASPW